MCVCVCEREGGGREMYVYLLVYCPWMSLLLLLYCPSLFFLFFFCTVRWALVSGMGIGKSAWGVLTEPEWLGSRGHQGPGGVQGQRPIGRSRGEKPPGRKRIWVFWRPVCCLSVHRNCENHFFFFCLEVEDQNQHFITFSITPIFKTTNIKSDSQDHKIY